MCSSCQTRVMDTSSCGKLTNTPWRPSDVRARTLAPRIRVLSRTARAITYEARVRTHVIIRSPSLFSLPLAINTSGGLRR